MGVCVSGGGHSAPDSHQMEGADTGKQLNITPGHGG